jgi:hypothetical protein
MPSTQAIEQQNAMADAMQQDKREKQRREAQYVLHSPIAISVLVSNVHARTGSQKG